MDMGIVAATKLRYRRLLLSPRTSDLADAQSLRMRVELTRIPAGIWGLAEGHPPYMLGTVWMLKLAWSEVDDTTIA